MELLRVDAAAPDLHRLYAVSEQLLPREARRRQVQVRDAVQRAEQRPDRGLEPAEPVAGQVARQIGVV